MINNTILIVDDTITNLDILVDLLDTYTVMDAINGKDALEIANEEDIDLILLDIMMPDMDGYEVCKRLKSNPKTKDIPVIFITANIDEDSIEKAYEVGGIDYVTKPFRPRELLARVKTQLIIQKQHIRLIQSEKLASINEMIKNISHQWRQPLSVISTASTGIKLKKEYGLLTDEWLDEACDVVNNNAQYLSKTIEDFGKYIQDNNEIINSNLHNINNNFLELVNPLTKEYNINIVLNTNKDINIKGMPNQFIQCFLSMFNNAKDALVQNNKKDNRYLFITHKIVDDEIKIIFKDNAGGIQYKIIDKVFEPYTTTKHQSQGTGLGLYIAYNFIVNNMNGSIDIENVQYEYDNKKHNGAKVVISLKI